eukprot:TRINITY_DN2830_c0_g2_i1.p1 TRINITY_DN2830_c0_g2~~TRINITY_DN2830_c0_g2_i1.p1  ORF type:complete len:458 (+),score=116.22 TRINITY_DN2830_c0_g2_i1:116-1489(+)
MQYEALGSDRWLRYQHIHDDFVADVVPTVAQQHRGRAWQIGSKDQNIDGEFVAGLLGRQSPAGASRGRSWRRSRSHSPPPSCTLTLEQRMGPHARLRCRSVGWRPLRPRVRPRNAAPADLSRTAETARAPSIAHHPHHLLVTAQRGAESTPPTLPGTPTDSALPTPTANSAQCQQHSRLSMWTSDLDFVFEPPPAAPLQRRQQQQQQQPGALGCPPQTVWAWRYGRGGEWHSVQGCTVAVERGTIKVVRSGALQQLLPCADATCAVTYSALGRLIVCGRPGCDSLFLSLDKEPHRNATGALRRSGVEVRDVSYGEFFATQKRLTFPPVPLESLGTQVEVERAPGPGPERRRGGGGRSGQQRRAATSAVAATPGAAGAVHPPAASQQPRQRHQQGPQPPPPQPSGDKGGPVAPDAALQRELLEQLRILQQQSSQLRAMESRLAALQQTEGSAPSAAAP